MTTTPQYTFSLQKIVVATNNGNGTFGTGVTGASTETVDVNQSMVSDETKGNAVITSRASQTEKYQLSLGTASFDLDVWAILFNKSVTSSNGGYYQTIDDQQRSPIFGLVAQAFPDNGDVLLWWPNCKLMTGVTWKNSYGKIVIPQFKAEAINDTSLGYMFRLFIRPNSGAITFPPQIV